MTPADKAAYISAYATVALAIVGIVGTIFAYKAAMAAIAASTAANETLRLETEPILIGDVFRDASMNIGITIRDVRGQLEASDSESLQGNNTAIRIKNVGRSPATNVTAIFLFEDTATKARTAFKQSIPKLGPDEFMYGLQNLTSTRLKVTVRVTSASVMSRNKVEDAEVFSGPFELAARRLERK